MRKPLCVAAVIAAFASRSAGAQKPPAIRQIGQVERISSDSLASIATALPMPGGRVLVNDITARRVLLFDSTLTHATVIADTTSATANAYGRFPGTLIRYRGDTALYIDASTLSMYILGPTGAVVRVAAVPRPGDMQGLIGGLYGMPGVDPSGRLVYFSGAPRGFFPIIRRGSRVPVGPNGPIPDPDLNEHIDSAFVVRVDLATRVVDTTASFKVTRFNRSLKTDATGLMLSIEMIPDPLPLVDDWAMMPDGSIAVVRGRDYHIDWLTPDGHRSSSSKMPFDWRHVDEERKQALIDSAVAALQTKIDDIVAGLMASGGGAGRSGSGGGGANPQRPGTGTPPVGSVPTIAKRPTPSDLPDFDPPFASGASRADADGNLWIRTTTVVAGQPVYDVVNRRGELFDRVQLPSFRTIAGFGPGVVYMAVKDSASAVHLERARIGR